MAIAMPDLSWAEQQRAGFCRMVRLGCGSNLRNSDALMQKHSNWKARRAKDNPTIAPAAGCKGHSGSFSGDGGVDLSQAPADQLARATDTVFCCWALHLLPAPQQLTGLL
jgi:hypothetical protein